MGKYLKFDTPILLSIKYESYVLKTVNTQYSDNGIVLHCFKIFYLFKTLVNKTHIQVHHLT